MNIAVVGYGMMGQSHINALRTLGYSVKMVMGRDENRTKKFALENGISNYCVDFDELVKNEINVLHICSPPASHFEIIKNALNNNMHVICEKPFVLDVEEGKELCELVKKQKLVGAVGFNVRFHEAIKHAKNIIKCDELGQICLVHGSYLQEFHALPAFYSWRYESRDAGKMLATTEIGSHWIDLLRYLTGKEVSAVSAQFGDFFKDRVLVDGMMYPEGTDGGKKISTDTENVVLLNFKLSGGALANVVLSEISPGRYNYLDMTVTGSAGSIWWNSEELNRLHSAKKSQKIETEVLAFADGFSGSIINMIKAVYQDILMGVQSSDCAYATFEDGLMNTKVCNAIYKSAHENTSWEVV